LEKRIETKETDPRKVRIVTRRPSEGGPSRPEKKRPGSEAAFERKYNKNFLQGRLGGKRKDGAEEEELVKNEIVLGEGQIRERSSMPR